MKLLIWGTGGHARVVMDSAIASEPLVEIAFIDDNRQGMVSGYPILGTRAALPVARLEGFDRFIVAIGDNAVRAHCFRLALEHAFTAACVIHPSASISPNASISAGSVVMPRAVINAGARIGTNCIINTAAVVEHDCVIADDVHISPGVLLGGGVSVGQSAHLGLGSIALPGAEIGECAVVGAGSVVLRKVPAGTTVVGVPCRPLPRG
ncbi:MAG: acetyltransferase [Bryobacteraceae bacterium]